MCAGPGRVLSGRDVAPAGAAETLQSGREGATSTGSRRSRASGDHPALRISDGSHPNDALPPVPSLAKAIKTASARSGERPSRRFVSAFCSTTRRPRESMDIARRAKVGRKLLVAVEVDQREPLGECEPDLERRFG